MTSATRDLVLLVLSILAGLVGACPTTGCAATGTTRAPATGPVGPGATVMTINLADGILAAVAGLTAVAAAAGAYALWKHQPNRNRTPAIAGKEP